VYLQFPCILMEKEVVVYKKDDNQVILNGFRYNNVYFIDFTLEDVNLKTCLFTKTSLGMGSLKEIDEQRDGYRVARCCV
jgi:hypothetical protein